MPPEVRRIRPDEYEPWLDSLSTSFLGRPDTRRIAEVLGPLADFNRTWGAFDGRVVGTLRTWPTELTVPGGALVPAAAVAAVTVLATHRRRGILRRMIGAEHAAARERGELLGLLYASEASIYGRFGYGMGVALCTWVLDRRSGGFREPLPTGVELVPVAQPAAELLQAVYDRFRRARVGEIRRRDFSFEFDLGLRESPWGPPWKGWLAVHRGVDGEVDGYARYAAEEKWEHDQPRSTLTVNDLVAITDDAYDALWRFLGSVDLVATVRAGMRSPAERLPWLLGNRRAAMQEDPGDGLWVCLLDPRAALEARAYERDGDVVLEIVRAEPDGGRGRLRLEAGPDGARCRPSRRSADLTLHADAIGAAYLGGTPLSRAVLVHGVDEHRPGALAEADALFRTLAIPTCQTHF